MRKIFSIKKIFTKKILLSLIIFTVTFLLCAFAVKELWFREDDLGQIINGIIRSWDDFLRVFSSDERDLIVPINYRRSKPNVISGFVRPLKNVFFTIVYYSHGLDVYAYYKLHVFLHALNAVLFFYLLNLWLPLSLAFLGGFMFSFFPDVSWLVWIATVHNSLATLFLLLSLLYYYAFWIRKQNNAPAFSMLFLSGIMFFLSLLSRENGIFYPFWIFAGVFLLLFNAQINTGVTSNFFKKILATFKKTLAYTWVFFFMHALYVLMRLYIFGIGTLTRTYNNLFLRFPFLTKYFGTFTNTSSLQQTQPLAVPPIPASISTLNTIAQAAPAKICFWEHLSTTLQHILDKILIWANMIFSLDLVFSNKFYIILFLLIFAFFFYIAYKNSKILFLFFIIGIASFIWPALLVYPSSRYVNCVYPIIIALFMFGIYNLFKKEKTTCPSNLLMYVVTIFLCIATINNAYINLKTLKSAGASTVPNKKRFEDFFATNKFNKNTNFMVFSSPFVSDIQNIFQYFLNDLSVKVTYELFTTIAERGIFGCQTDYRITGVKRKIQPIESGYRIISQDKQHSACWMNFSSFAMWWSEKDKAYEWGEKLYEIDTWYPCSMGKFKIHERLDNKYITDISFVFDHKWFDENTVVVTWDTLTGKYIVLDSSHLKK